MLVLTRKLNQSIVINDQVEVVVLEIRGEQVRLGIKAPKDVPVHRKEIFDQIQDENKSAAEISVDDIPE
jgi:carbon storage regulator